MSKVQVAIDTVRKNSDKAPKDVISELEVTLDMARRGASTYYYNAKSKIAAESVDPAQAMKDAKNARRRELRAVKKAEDAAKMAEQDIVPDAAAA